MIRRQPHHKPARRDEQALLSPEAAPILSDDHPSDYAEPEITTAGHHNIHENENSNHNNSTSNHSGSSGGANKKKSSWRSRLFGGSNTNNSGNRANSSRSAGRAVSASRSGSNGRAIRKAATNSSSGRNGTVSATRGQQQQQQQQQRHHQHPELQQTSSSSDTATGRTAAAAAASSSRPSAPLRSRPETRDDDSNKGVGAASSSSAAKTSFIPQSSLRQSRSLAGGSIAASTPSQRSTNSSSSSHHHRHRLPQQPTPHHHQHHSMLSSLQQSASHASEKSERSFATSRSRASSAAPAGLVTTILKRPFGRETAIRPQDQTWLVRIAPAEWEGDEAIWKYRVAIQKRVQSDEEEIIQDLTNGMTFRSLADFYWLEQALQSEFHGGLLIPPLSIALGVPDLESCQHEVDARLLTNWLSDVLNGVRGQGEWILASSLAGGSFSINWQTCEAMEAFMYRTDLQPIGDVPYSPNSNNGKSPRGRNAVGSASDKLKWEDEQVGGGGGGILKYIINGDMCGFTSACAPRDEKVLSPPKPKKINLPLNRHTVSSSALGDARTLNVQDSFVESSTATTTTATALNILAKNNKPTVPVYEHLDLLEAEQELIWNWRTRALSLMEKLRVVQNEEKHIAAAWKRFAISISNLFAYEKEVESARLGDAKTRKDLQMPYRKLQKSAVEDVLRIVAKQKVERCTPSLDMISAMLSAYVADLSSVQPAVQSYLDGLQQLTMQMETVRILEESKPAEQIPSSTLADQIQSGLDQVKKQLVAKSVEAAAGEARQMEARLQQAESQLGTMETSIRKNEAMLQVYLTRFCRTVPVRTARMAHGYIQTEAKQTSAMHAAAINMRTRINVASKESLSKMIRRHGIEIKDDRAAELQLVQRMVNLGNSKKFSKLDDGTEEVERGVEINKDTENRKGELRDMAMELCRSRIGRWDSRVAMAIMEAVGVEDANVRVEETTRDLRLVRKYAIGLRENVQRCIEALEVLRMSILQGGFGDIRDLRHDMMAEVQTLFSGAYQPDEQPKTPLNVRTLIEKGVALNDPLGWLRKEDGCGGAAKTYMDTRESGTEWLLISLGELLKEYFNRVEAVESFVYMECVGIQLEKHFSQERATALAAFEKKTDITSAINIATRKRMPVLVKELQAKLEAVGADVSHTTVKEAKEAHLESKALKQELHDLSMRQLSRARETATERVISLMTLWAKEEETASSVELDVLNGFNKTLEQSIGTEELNPYLEASPLV